MGERFASVPDIDRRRAVETLTLAFASDPVVRWLYPEPSQYLMHFDPFLKAFGGTAFAGNTAWRLGDFAAAAMWLAPGVGLDDDAIVTHFETTVSPEKHEDLWATLDQMDDAHPKDRHWYLAWAGVDAAMQGQGLGSELLGLCLEIVDQDHVPAYLDNTNPRNIAFYERHGFKVIGESQAGMCPPLFPMLREAR